MKREKIRSLPLLFFCLCGIGVLLFANIAKAEEETTGAKILLQGECGAYQAVYDEEDDEFYEYDDEDLPYNVDDVRFTLYEDGTMVISGNGKMEDYTIYDYAEYRKKRKLKYQIPWYEYRKKIKKLIIEEGITAVGWNSFLNCKNLKTIQWPESLQRVGSFAFENCTGLEEVTLPANVQEWYPMIFSGCTGIKKVTLEEGIQFGEPGAYRYGEGMFMDCTSLETVIFPEDLTVIPARFVLGCSSMKEYTLPEGLVMFGSYPAAACPEKLVLPETVKYMDRYAFLDVQILRN